MLTTPLPKFIELFIPAISLNSNLTSLNIDMKWPCDL